MSKEYIQLKAKDIYKLLHETYNVPTVMCNLIGRYLQLLESIVNTEPNEALTEIFNIIYNLDCGTTFEQDMKLNECRKNINRALYRLKFIANSNPSEALECFERIDNTLCLNNLKGKLEFGIDDEEHIDCDSVIGMTEDLESIKAALLKSQVNARSEEILQKYYQEGITLDSVRALKKEIDELRKKVQEPKCYLKWDDLEFSYNMKNVKVKMGDNEYIIRYFLNALDDYECFLCDVERNQLIRLYKQFFNDLHLEVIKDE